MEKRETGGACSGSTQTDFDTVDYCRILVCSSVHPKERVSSEQAKNSRHKGGLLSTFLTIFVPYKHDYEKDHPFVDKRCVSTQTEESPIAFQGHQLCWMVIQELVLEKQVKSSFRSNVFEALCCFVCEILVKHEILLNGMLRRFEAIELEAFTSIANELFEATTNAESRTITWGRVVSLFAFAVKLAQKCKETQKDEKINAVVMYLSHYISQNLLDFLQAEGGWEGLIKHFPISGSEENQLNRVMMWSALFAFIGATVYVTLAHVKSRK